MHRAMNIKCLLLKHPITLLTIFFSPAGLKRFQPLILIINIPQIHPFWHNFVLLHNL